MKTLLVLLMIPHFAAATLAIDFGDSLRPQKPVVLYFEGRAYRYADQDASRFLLLLFKLTHPAREASFVKPNEAIGVGRQIVPAWGEYGARLRELGHKLVAAKIIGRAPPDRAPTNEELIAYMNAQGPRLTERTYTIEIKPLQGPSTKVSKRLSAAGRDPDPLSQLLGAYSWDWPVTRRVRDTLELRSFR